MLVAETPEKFRLVPQPDHSRQVGEIARHWGNETFDPPAPRSSMLVAAELHDNGWWKHDLRPHLAGDGPAGALDVGPAVWPAFYQRAVERTASVDPYAAVLVSMHGTGIRRNRYGLSPAMPDYSDVYAEFIANQESRQRALLDDVIDATTADGDASWGDREEGVASDDGVERDGSVPAEARAFLTSLHAEGAVDDVDRAPPRLFANYARLQAWDQLSIHLCRNIGVDRITIEHVPVDDDGETTTIDVTRVDDTTARLDPYPFDDSPVSAPLNAKTIPKRAYTERDLTEAYFEASMESITYTFVR